LDAFESVCSDLVFLYCSVSIPGDFNVNFPDPGHVLFALFYDLLETLSSIILLFCRQERYLVSS
jgi:hypothetical protein